MEYQEEIKKHEEAIKALKMEMNETKKVDYSEYIGKCYQLASTSYIKVLDVYDKDENGIYCKYVRVYIDDADDSSASIDTSAEDDIDNYILEYHEITATELTRLLNKAIEIINKNF